MSRQKVKMSRQKVKMKRVSHRMNREMSKKVGKNQVNLKELILVQTPLHQNHILQEIILKFLPFMKK